MDKKKKYNFNYMKFIPLFLFIMSLIMEIGYAAINSISLDISGNASATAQEGVFITEVLYKSSVEADDINSTINDFPKTILNSKIILSKSNPNSSITYSVTVYNNSIYDYAFKEAIYGTEWYDNNDIIYTISGINKYDILKSKQSMTFDITFSYKDNVIAQNNILNSYINFNFLRFFNVNYINFSSSDIANFPSIAFKNEPFNINLSEYLHNINIKMGGKLLLKDTDYTILNDVLNINNVNDNLIIEKINVFTPKPNNNNNFITGTPPKGGTIESENWDGNIYNLTFSIPKGYSFTNSYTYTLQIKNNSKFVWSNFTLNDQIVESTGDIFGKYLKEFKSSISPNSVKPGKILTITFNIKYRLSSNSNAYGKTILSFDSNNNKEKIDINIRFNVK